MGKIVAIIGSSKFKELHLGAAQKETLQGNIALNYGFYHHVDKFPISDAQKHKLDALNEAKVKMADEVFVINPNGYIGQTTQTLIEVARSLDKPVRYLLEPGVV